LGEVGRTGVAIDSLADMEILLAGIPLGEVSTSMTLNAPASLLLLLYELVAEGQGVAPEALRGTVQNDILKEYIARGNYIFPPRPSMRLTTDLFAYCAERIPRWNTISISGYHIREAGATAVQELAFTLANGIAYCRAAVDAGLSPDDFGERLSFFFNAHNDFFQEVAKFRAARRLWARVMKERFGATNPKAQALRFHAQTGGSTLTAELEARAWELIERVDELGGAVQAIERGFVQSEIEQAAFEWQQQVERGERVIVGVNRYEEDEPERVELHRLDPEAERRQLERTARVRAERNTGEAARTLEAVREAARGDANLLPVMRDRKSTRLNSSH